jgi:hypothetical protein
VRNEFWYSHQCVTVRFSADLEILFRVKIGFRVPGAKLRGLPAHERCSNGQQKPCFVMGGDFPGRPLWAIAVPDSTPGKPRDTDS